MLSRNILIKHFKTSTSFKSFCCWLLSTLSKRKHGRILRLRGWKRSLFVAFLPFNNAQRTIITRTKFKILTNTNTITLFTFLNAFLSVKREFCIVFSRLFCFLLPHFKSSWSKLNTQKK